MLISIRLLIMQKLEENSSGSGKKKTGFLDNLREELDEKFSKTQNDCEHIDFYPCVNCVTIKFKQLSQNLYEKCCPLFEKNISFKGKCKKLYNTEIKLA